MTNAVKLDTQFPMKRSDIVRMAKSTIGSLISSEGFLLCTETCNKKVESDQPGDRTVVDSD